MTDDTLTITQDDKEETHAIETKAQMEDMLHKYFNISLQIPDY